MTGGTARRVSVVLTALVLLLAGFSAGWFLQRGSSETPNATDVGYLQDMTEHHAQAVAMSVTLLEREGVSPGTREAARRILLSQQADIGLMQGWLQVWGEPEQSTRPMHWMSSSAHDHTSGDASPMPGSVDSAQISSLGTAPVREAEAQFLDLMAAHHEGALEMARVARRQAATTAVRGLGKRTEQAQRMEIAQLRGLRELLPR